MGVPGRKFEIIHEVISQDNNKLTITELCNIAGVSRSGYYRWLNSNESRKLRDGRDRADFELIVKAYYYRGYQKGARRHHFYYSRYRCWNVGRTNQYSQCPVEFR